MLDAAKRWARRLKRDVLALFLAGRDPRVPWHAKAMALATAAYALSPIDLIPDFIPLLGYLDELVILPLAILLTVRLIPGDVMADLRDKAERCLSGQRPKSLIGAAVIIGVWLACAAAAWWMLQ